jgi:hypothetical protein
MALVNWIPYFYGGMIFGHDLYKGELKIMKGWDMGLQNVIL